MSTLRISDIAERTGFSVSTLRYYEQLGLVRPVERTASGYRVYDERAVDRLAFVARAKGLGLSLDDIAVLARLWDGDRCGPVQHRLRSLLADKQAEVRRRTDELVRFAAELDGVARRLDAPGPDGPCDETCGCLTDGLTADSPAFATPVPLTAKPPAAGPPAAGPIVAGPPTAGPIVAGPPAAGPIVAGPIACTLDATAVPERLAAWRAVIALATDRRPTDAGLRLTFPAADGLAGRLAELARAEQSCCAFLTFSLRLAGHELVLDVGAPPDGRDALLALFGGAA